MRTRVLILVAALWPLIAPVAATSADLTPVGLWQATDDKTKEPTGWFLISDHDGVYRRHHRQNVLQARRRLRTWSAINARTIARTIPGSASKSSAA